MSFVRIDPIDFYRTFRTVVDTEPEQTTIAELWTQPKSYTHFIRANVFPLIASRLELSHYPGDYYLLDGVYFAEKDEENFPAKTFAKYIAVAIEHENAPSGSVNEMNKLQLFNAPLKVLITYPKKPSDGTELLDKYERIIRSADVFQQAAKEQRQVVIFGHYPGERPYWEAFLYTADGFTRIEQAATA